MNTHVPRALRTIVCALATLVCSGCAGAPTDREVAKAVIGTVAVAAPIGAAILAGYSKSGW